MNTSISLNVQTADMKSDDGRDNNNLSLMPCSQRNDCVIVSIYADGKYTKSRVKISHLLTALDMLDLHQEEMKRV